MAGSPQTASSGNYCGPIIVLTGAVAPLELDHHMGRPQLFTNIVWVLSLPTEFIRAKVVLTEKTRKSNHLEIPL